jgi:hypothetical protein
VEDQLGVSSMLLRTRFGGEALLVVLDAGFSDGFSDCILVSARMSSAYTPPRRRRRHLHHCLTPWPTSALLVVLEVGLAGGFSDYILVSAKVSSEGPLLLPCHLHRCLTPWSTDSASLGLSFDRYTTQLSSSLSSTSNEKIRLF